jgi:hypothetical protein
MLQIVFSVSLESSHEHGLGSMKFGLAVQKFLNIEWIFHWNLNLSHGWNFWRNWNVPLVLLERSWWAGFNGIYSVRFGLRMWEILIFQWFLLLKIEKIIIINHVLEGKISWGWDNTWANGAGHTSYPLWYTYGSITTYSSGKLFGRSSELKIVPNPSMLSVFI